MHFSVVYLCELDKMALKDRTGGRNPERRQLMWKSPVFWFRSIDRRHISLCVKYESRVVFSQENDYLRKRALFHGVKSKCTITLCP